MSVAHPPHAGSLTAFPPEAAKTHTLPHFNPK